MQDILNYGEISSFTFTNSKGELESRELKVEGDYLIIPNTLTWQGSSYFVNQIILTKPIFQQLFKEWIQESTESTNPMLAQD